MLSTTHGTALVRKTLYRGQAAMHKPKRRQLQNYGARGIKFCFPNATAAGQYMIEKYGLPDRALEIDRINVNGNYEPGNLRWVTHQENCQNQRRYLER